MEKQRATHMRLTRSQPSLYHKAEKTNWEWCMFWENGKKYTAAGYFSSMLVPQSYKIVGWSLWVVKLKYGILQISEVFFS